MENTFKRITVKARLWWGKTLNGSNGKKSFLMRGGEIPFWYEGRATIQAKELEEFIKTNKEWIVEDLEQLREKAAEKTPSASVYVTMLVKASGVSRMIKGLRGAMRHNIMRILHQKSIEYCAPTQKREFQGTKEPTLLGGEHLMGECGELPCPIRQLFGSWNEESTIRVWSDAMVETDKPVEKIRREKGISFAYVSMEERHAARRDRKTLQDFSEQYLCGEFQFYVEFMEELPQWLIGLLLEGILAVENVGNGRSTGYGRVETKEISFEQVVLKRKLGNETNGKVTIIEEEQVTSLNNKIKECLDAWSNYN